MANETQGYQRFLLSEFDLRRQRNPQYSLRAYARDLGLAAPKLSEILRGKCGLSETSAQKLIPKLGLTSDEAEVFIQMVIAKHARSPRQRLEAQTQLKQSSTSLRFSELSLESFKIIADWYHFAILELTEVSGFRSEVNWIASRLGLDRTTTSEAIQRLVDFGLLKKNKDGQWYQTDAVLATPSGIPSSEIRKHHRQILTKADQALLKVPVTERDFSATTLAVAEEDLAEVQAEIKKFRRALAAKLNKSKNKNRVYCLSVQFFPLDEKGNKL